LFTELKIFRWSKVSQYLVRWYSPDYTLGQKVIFQNEPIFSRALGINYFSTDRSLVERKAFVRSFINEVRVAG
jgi:hypothetical protein